MELLDAALAWHDAGASVLPAGRGKMPAKPWKDFQTARLSVTELTELLLTGEYDGIGLVTGFNGFEMFELEGRAAHLLADLLALLPAALVVKLMTYTERSPKGGFHFVYRVDPEHAMDGSTKLARMPDETAAAGWSVTIETRGRYGWTVLAPSGGRVHDEIPGGRWVLTGGAAGQVAVLTEEEREALFDAARSLDEMPPAPIIEHRPAMASTTSGDLTPGQDFEARADWMADILGPAGWTVNSREGEKTFLTRPGKKFGKSATLNYDGNDNLYVFTSSTDFPEMSSWTKFGAYAHLHHDGDYSSAARELRRQGYGSQRETSTAQAESRAMLSLIQGGQAPTTSGANALAPREESSSPAGSTLQQSEDGHAQLLIQAYGAVIRYAVEQGKWLWWDGARWHLQADGGMVREYAKEVARSFPEDSPSALRHKGRALASNGTSGALKQASTDRRVVVSVNDLDALPRELNTPGGILDLETKTLGQADPAHLHTHMTLCAPDWEANRKLWDDFLDQTFGGDPELIAWVQRVVGYSAIGEVGPHVLPFCHGSGGNGKGVFLETIMAILGDYAAPASNDFLMAGRDRHSTEIAALAGKRMVVCSEVNEDDRFDEAKVKRLTGGDRLKARFMRMDEFSFDPSHTLWLVGNHDPEMKSGGRSMERRLAKIPFDHEVSDDDRIDGLKDRLVAECGPAILAWIADGAAAYLAHGLGEAPAQVRRATDEYTHGADTIAQFIEERCRVGGGQMVQVAMKAVRQAYEDFCEELSVEPRSAKALGQALRRAGVEEAPNRASRGGRHYANLFLLATEAETPDRTSVQGILPMDQ